MRRRRSTPKGRRAGGTRRGDSARRGLRSDAGVGGAGGTRTALRGWAAPRHRGVSAAGVGDSRAARRRRGRGWAGRRGPPCGERRRRCHLPRGRPALAGPRVRLIPGRRVRRAVLARVRVGETEGEARSPSLCGGPVCGKSSSSAPCHPLFKSFQTVPPLPQPPPPPVKRRS